MRSIMNINVFYNPVYAEQNYPDRDQEKCVLFNKRFNSLMMQYGK